MFKKIISTFLIWRILLFIPLYFSPMLLPFRDGFSYTQLWDYVGPYFPVTSPLLWPWANFDGVRYLSIAGAWYSNDQGFFPLFPLAVNFFATLFGTKKAFDLTYFTMAFLVANISFTLALWILNKLLSLDFPKKIAYQSILFLLVFPTSFFFASIYSESLFLLLSLLSFYFARKQKWSLLQFIQRAFFFCFLFFHFTLQGNKSGLCLEYLEDCFLQQELWELQFYRHFYMSFILRTRVRYRSTGRQY